jgi:hypothetical protein
MAQRAGEQGEQKDNGGQTAQGRRVHRRNSVRERDETHHTTLKKDCGHHAMAAAARE